MNHRTVTLVAAAKSVMQEVRGCLTVHYAVPFELPYLGKPFYSHMCCCWLGSLLPCSYPLSTNAIA